MRMRAMASPSCSFSLVVTAGTVLCCGAAHSLVSRLLRMLCCAWVYWPVPQSSYATNSRRTSPAVMQSSPRLRISVRTGGHLSEVQRHIPRVGGQGHPVEGLHGVSRTVLRPSVLVVRWVWGCAEP